MNPWIVIGIFLAGNIVSIRAPSNYPHSRSHHGIVPTCPAPRTAICRESEHFSTLLAIPNRIA
jgi:hypothetical protein